MGRCFVSWLPWDTELAQGKKFGDRQWHERPYTGQMTTLTEAPLALCMCLSFHKLWGGLGLVERGCLASWSRELKH